MASNEEIVNWLVKRRTETDTYIESLKKQHVKDSIRKLIEVGFLKIDLKYIIKLLIIR